MATRFMTKIVWSAALGIGVLVLGLGVAGATSVARTNAVPLAGIKLVSETSVASFEVAAAARNGRGGRRHRLIWKTQVVRDANSQAGELVAIDMR